MPVVKIKELLDKMVYEALRSGMEFENDSVKILVSSEEGLICDEYYLTVVTDEPIPAEAKCTVVEYVSDKLSIVDGVKFSFRKEGSHFEGSKAMGVH
jgi:hypothetical protein